MYTSAFRYDEAIVDLDKELQLQAQSDNFGVMTRIVIGTVLVHLTRGDPVAADKFFNTSLR